MTLRLLLKFLEERFAVSGRKVLILDYDGTLAPFTENPSDALPYEGIRELLLKIRQAGGEVFFVTGREPEEIVALIGLSPPFETWGCHGAVRLLPNGKRHSPNLPESVFFGLNKAEALLKQIGLGRVERKTTSVAFHWRNCCPKEVGRVRKRAIETLKPIASLGFSLLDFDGGIELLAEGFDKGTAIREILRDASEKDFAVFLGDDLTDEKGFVEVNRRGGAGVLVTSHHRKTDARFFLVPPFEVRVFLETWLSGLEKGGIP